MPVECPFCNWWIRKIDTETGLWECSNPHCNCIIQKYEPKPETSIKTNGGLEQWNN